MPLTSLKIWPIKCYLHFLKDYPSHYYYIFQHFTHYSVIISFNILLVRVSGFSRLGQLVGKIILAKRPKTAWKLQNQHFGVKTVGEMVGKVSVFGVFLVQMQEIKDQKNFKHRHFSRSVYNLVLLVLKMCFIDLCFKLFLDIFVNGKKQIFGGYIFANKEGLKRLSG